MSEIYVFAPDNDDFSTIGECGALEASSCLFEEIANGESELTLEHPLDPLGKYRFLTVGAVLKAEVPVRTTPEIEGGKFVTSVEKWTVKSTATKAERYVYSKKEGGKKKKLLKAGTTVAVTSKPADAKRWKVKSGKTTGWLNPDALEADTTVTIPDTPDGMEDAVPAWECRDQLFRIYKVNRADTGISVNARHISYDLMYNLTTYDVDTAVQLQTALDGVLDDCLDAHDFAAYTDIQGERTGVHAADKNPIEAILDPEEGLATAWGAQLVRDDFELYLLSRAGGNRGMTIEYARNLTGVDVDEDLSDVATHIRPIGQKKDGKPLYLEENDGLVESPLAGNYPYKRIQVLECENCTVGKGGVTAAIARARMKEQAQALFDQGADRPKVSAKVTFALLGQSARYAQYRSLESVYLYDEVQIRHPALGIDLTTQVVRAIWDCLRERMTSIELGALEELAPSVSGWQISGGISGAKLVAGSVGSSQLGDDIINARHVQADSINTDALQAESITGDKIKGGTITGDLIAGGTITGEHIQAGVLDALVANIDWASIGTLQADIAKLVQASIGTADIDWAQIKDLISGRAIFTQGEAGKLFIADLAVTEANMVSLTVGELVVKGADGRFYSVSVDEAGRVQTELKQVSNDDVTDLSINAGEKLIEGSVTAACLNATDIFADNAIIRQLMAANLDVDTFFAREGVINALKAMKIWNDKSLLLLAQEAEAGANAAQGVQDAKSAAEQAATDAQSAKNAASSAQSSANQAAADAQNAQTTAEDAMELAGDAVTHSERSTYMEIVAPGSTRSPGVYIGLREGESQPATEAFIDAAGWFRVLQNGVSITALGPRIQELGSLRIYETVPDGGHAFV